MNKELWFEGRSLKPYAEPVTSIDLKEGFTYFAVNFVDEDMLIPSLEPIVFVGRNLDPDDIDQVYFQDFESYRSGIRFGSREARGGGARFYVGAESETNHIFDYERALDGLLRCALKRQGQLEPRPEGRE
jgi:hypothetical protein